MGSYGKAALKLMVAFTAILVLVGCASQGGNTVTASETPTTSVTPTPTASPLTDSITYTNAKYGFTFTLPKSWKGFSIVKGKWEGNDVKSGAITETGPMISIRHPLWKATNVRQDIPIFVFTTTQWNSLTASTFHIGAAPIPPSELGHNSNYVFALPARYNFAFPTGFEEVQKILDGNPLHVN
jgi:hypothetical protein